MKTNIFYVRTSNATEYIFLLKQTFTGTDLFTLKCGQFCASITPLFLKVAGFML